MGCAWDNPSTQKSKKAPTPPVVMKLLVCGPDSMVYSDDSKQQHVDECNEADISVFSMISAC